MAEGDVLMRASTQATPIPVFVRAAREAGRSLPMLASIATLLASACGYAERGEGGDSGVLESGAGFVGRQACADCHAAEARAWTGSHHDLAMQEATEESVLGDFSRIPFSHLGRSYEFFRENGGFFVRADGPDGQLQAYEVAYTFGVDPLQQYLVQFPGGRLQALSVAWDARPEEEGGGRWFHLYPDEAIGPEDELHWTRPSHNWNYMCAECHSTGLVKGYLPDQDRYETTWAEVDVSCEACHGPGAGHVTWGTELGPEAGSSAAREGTEGGGAYAARLAVDLGAGGHVWSFDDGARIARRSPPPGVNRQAEACGRCHSRRSTILDPYEFGKPLADTHLPALLEEGLYHADGQPDDEVYVYGSFLQSRMYAAGVTCTDCHDPHSLELRAEGNALCARCHLTEAYDSPEHHGHPPDSEGAACVACHMPAKTYMVVDPRRDHGFRIPRPDLAAETGAPDACTDCHTGRDLSWAAAAVRGWRGSGPSEPSVEGAGEGHFSSAITGGRAVRPESAKELAALSRDPSQPAIIRATAISLMARYRTQATFETTLPALADGDPLVRTAALRNLELLRPEQRIAPAAPLLEDPVRAVRIEAARVLADAPPAPLSATQAVALERALQEYVDAQLVSADHPSGRANLGLLHARRGQLSAAERELRTAIRLGPWFAPAYVNLADLYRLQGREVEGEALLREGLAAIPDEPLLHHALGLALARQERTDEAVEELERAVSLDPENARFAYVYGVALNSAGRSEDAVGTLEAALATHPYDREILFALATIQRDNGRPDAALGYARRIVEAWADDPDARRFLGELEAARR